MNYLVVLIVDDPIHCPAILNAWEDAGVSGVTILESTGLGRIRRGGLREDLPLFPSLHELVEGEEVSHRTLLSVVKEQEMVDEMVRLAQGIIGDLDAPHSGFLFVVPVLQAYGLNRIGK
jgi:nitrogen regulatory protein P-II 1